MNEGEVVREVPPATVITKDGLEKIYGAQGDFEFDGSNLVVNIHSASNIQDTS